MMNELIGQCWVMNKCHGAELAYLREPIEVFIGTYEQAVARATELSFVGTIAVHGPIPLLQR